MDLQEQIEAWRNSITFVEKDKNYDCDKCKDKGHTIVTRSDGMEAIQPCQCRKVNPNDKILCFHYDTTLSSEYESVSSSDFRPDMYGQSYIAKAKEIRQTGINFVKRYEEMKDIKPDLYLFSNRPGTGKTLLASIICTGLTKMHGLSSQAISTTTLMQMLRKSFSDNKMNEDDIINRLSSVSVLLLDDIGTEKHTDYTEEIFTSIIDNRLSQQLTTLYTSNLSVSELPYHARIKDRIAYNAVRIDFPDVSIRSIKGKKRIEQAKSILFK